MKKQRSILLVSSLLTLSAVFLTVALVSPAEGLQVKSNDIDSYVMRRSKIANTDAKGLYDLAREYWLKSPSNLKLLKYMRADLAEVLKLDKNNRRAKLVLQQVQAKIDRLEGKTNPQSSDSGDNVEVSKKDLVTKEDINWIRLRELRKDDVVTIQFKNNVITRYIAIMRGKKVEGWDKFGKEKSFLAMPRLRQVREILETQSDNDELLKDIRITKDPKFMLEFRNQVWPMIARSCAQSQCHGGAKLKGGFKFFTGKADADRVMYTNFIIMRGLNVGGDSERRIINRQTPENSLILQFLLNEKVAKPDFKHPKKIKPFFTSKRDPKYRRIFTWVEKLHGPMLPDYNLKWKPPYDMDVVTDNKGEIPNFDEE